MLGPSAPYSRLLDGVFISLTGIRVTSVLTEIERHLVGLPALDMMQLHLRGTDIQPYIPAMSINPQKLY